MPSPDQPAMTQIEEEVVGAFRDSSPMLVRSTPSPSSGSFARAKEPERELTYTEITAELAVLMNAANDGAPFDENRLDFLLKKQLESPEYRTMQSKELSKWQATNFSFLQESLDVTRSFVPATVFTDNLESLKSYGLSADICKRILQKQCLWLVRLDSSAIARLHESDLYHRYQPSLLDITELAAVYAVLPEVFMNDPLGKKLEWKENMYESLKRMMADRDTRCLPKGKLRAPCYEAYFASGAAASAASPVPAGGIVVPDMFSPLNSPAPKDAASGVTSVFQKLSVYDSDSDSAAAAASAASAPMLASRHRRNTVGTCSSSKPDILAEKEDNVPVGASASVSEGQTQTRVPFAAGGSEEAKPVPRLLGYGPIADLTSLHKTDIVKGGYGQRRSFTETCGQHSILSKLKRKSTM
jgi:hypothetical protein